VHMMLELNVVNLYVKLVGAGYFGARWVYAMKDFW